MNVEDFQQRKLATTYPQPLQSRKNKQKKNKKEQDLEKAQNGIKR